MRIVQNFWNSSEYYTNPPLPSAGGDATPLSGPETVRHDECIKWKWKLSLRTPFAGFIVFVIFHKFGLISATQTVFASPFNPLGELRTLFPAHNSFSHSGAPCDDRRQTQENHIWRTAKRMHRFLRLKGRQLKFFVFFGNETIISSAQKRIFFSTFQFEANKFSFCSKRPRLRTNA